MRKFIAVCIFIFAPFALGSGIWIQSPTVSRSEFEAFLHQNPENQSYIQFMLGKQLPQDISGFSLQWAQSLLEQKDIPLSFSRDLEIFETENTMDKSRRAFLLGFLQKLKDKNPTEKALAKQLCKWGSFPGEAEAGNCGRRPQSLSSLASKLPDIEVLLLEDYPVALHSGASLNIDPNDVFNWRLLSNAQKMVSFRGSLQDLRNQEFHFENIVRGNCDSFSHGVDDMELASNGFVYFAENCKKSVREPETLRAGQWLAENRSWIIPAGIAVLGAIAYQYRNKKLVIEKPSFR